MFFVRRHIWLLAAVWTLTSIGCVARSQQTKVPRPAGPLSTSASPDASPPVQRGLHGVIAGSIEIVPGKSVGPLRIGDPRESSLDLFGKPNEEYTFGESATGPCRYTEAHWRDLEHEERWGVLTYSKNNRIYQIMVDTPRYATADGLTSDSSPEEVRRRFPKTEAYVLLHSGSKMVGGRDLIYWVDQSSGIAFEFYYHAKLNQRRVGNIVVFEPGVEFLPAGCVSPPQELHQVKPFSLEPNVN